jgi:hypothetical protein
MPEAVAINDDGGHIMNYTMIIPVLVESLKEKDAQITAQAGQIAALAARLERLEQLAGK